MKLTGYLSTAAFLAQLASIVAGAADTTTLTTGGTDTTSSSSTTTSATTVYVTTTLADGGVATVATTYSQKFSSFYTAVATPSSGSVGLGSLSGTVGELRTYQTMTVSST